LLEAVRAPGAKATLVNIWATWCVPCREEFPDLVRLERTYRDRGLRVLFVCADFDSEMPAARRFLAEHGVTYPSYFKTGDDMKFIDALSPKWSGALPATVLYDAAGTRRDSWEGQASYATFESKVNAVLEGRTLADSTEVDT
jgi:thiol-disulfide isomerase/thioredoxin